MPKSIIRVMAVFLVLCLIGNSAVASMSWNGIRRAGEDSASPLQCLYTSQALAPQMLDAKQPTLGEKAKTHMERILGQAASRVNPSTTDRLIATFILPEFLVAAGTSHSAVMAEASIGFLPWAVMTVIVLYIGVQSLFRWIAGRASWRSAPARPLAPASVVTLDRGGVLHVRGTAAGGDGQSTYGPEEDSWEIVLIQGGKEWRYAYSKASARFVFPTYDLHSTIECRSDPLGQWTLSADRDQDGDQTLTLVLKRSVLRKIPSEYRELSFVDARLKVVLVAEDKKTKSFASPRAPSVIGPDFTGPYTFSRGDWRVRFMRLLIGPALWTENISHMANLIWKDVLRTIDEYSDDVPVLLRNPAMLQRRPPPRDMPEYFLEWLSDLQTPLDGPLGFAISYALLFGLQFMSRPIDVTYQETKMGEIADALSAMGLHSSLPETDYFGKKALVLEAALFVGTPAETKWFFLLVDNELAYESPHDYIGATEFPIGERHYVVAIQRHILDSGDPQRFKAGLDHVLRETLLRGLLHYPTDPADKKALEDAQRGVPLENYSGAPAYQFIQRRASSAPGASHLSPPAVPTERLQKHLPGLRWLERLLAEVEKRLVANKGRTIPGTATTWQSQFKQDREQIHINFPWLALGTQRQDGQVLHSDLAQEVYARLLFIASGLFLREWTLDAYLTLIQEIKNIWAQKTEFHERIESSPLFDTFLMQPEVRSASLHQRPLWNAAVDRAAQAGLLGPEAYVRYMLAQRMDDLVGQSIARQSQLIPRRLLPWFNDQDLDEVAVSNQLLQQLPWASWLAQAQMGEILRSVIEPGIAPSVLPGAITRRAALSTDLPQISRRNKNRTLETLVKSIFDSLTEQTKNGEKFVWCIYNASAVMRPLEDRPFFLSFATSLWLTAKYSEMGTWNSNNPHDNFPAGIFHHTFAHDLLNGNPVWIVSLIQRRGVYWSLNSKFQRRLNGFRATGYRHFERLADTLGLDLLVVGERFLLAPGVMDSKLARRPSLRTAIHQLHARPSTQYDEEERELFFWPKDVLRGPFWVRHPRPLEEAA